MNNVDAQYLRIMGSILRSGSRREGRNGFTLSLFGQHMRFDLSNGFPLLTTKKVHFKSVLVELLWFLRGDTNVKFLHDHGVTIWDEWANENGDLGPVYGKQWRSWNAGWGLSVDQIANLIKGLHSDPFSRRHIVTAWNPADIEQMALPPCHCLFQFCVEPNDAGVPTWLSCHLYQRSADWFLGVPFNIASYALLTHLIAREVGLRAAELVMSFGDSHLYGNHLGQAQQQIERFSRTLPAVHISPDAGSVLHGTILPEHITLSDYDPHPAIKAEVSA